MNDRNTEFLTKIYQNARMGCESITYVSEKSNDEQLKQSLLKQHEQYNGVAMDATKLLNESGEPAKEKNPVSRAMLWSGVQMNTLADKSSNHIAEMMIQGSMMGVIDMSRNLKRYSDTDGKVIGLGEKLIEVEEKNIQRMKNFLC